MYYIFMHNYYSVNYKLSMSGDNELVKNQTEEQHLLESEVKSNRCKRRNTDLELEWIEKLELDDYLPTQNYTHELTLDDMEWLSYSHYGKVTGLNNFFAQFDSVDDMITKMYVKPLSMHHKERYGDNSAKYIKDWLLNSYLGYEIKLAEIHLNKLVEERELELVDIGAKTHSINKNYPVGRYSNPYDVLKERISLIYDHKLWGYFRTTNLHKIYIYVIARTTDPMPAKYEAMFHLGDTYKLMKDQTQTYPKISKMNPKSEERMAYNSQWVIYKVHT